MHNNYNLTMYTVTFRNGLTGLAESDNEGDDDILKWSHPPSNIIIFVVLSIFSDSRFTIFQSD